MSLPSLATADLLPEGLDPQAVEAASAAVRSYCRWHIAPSVVETVTLDGGGSRTVFLPSMRVTAVTSVTVDGVDVDVSTVQWSENGILWLPFPVYSWKLRGIVVTFTHGYDECPADVAAVLGSFAKRGVTASDIQAQAAGTLSVTYVAGGSGGATTIGSAADTLGYYKMPASP